MGSAPLWVLSGYGIVIRWWLRSPGSSSSSAANVNNNGARNNDIYAEELGKAGYNTLTEEREVKILFEIMEKRSELHNSTIVCSQREPKSWTAMILNDAVADDALLKRATKHYTVFISTR